MSIYMYRLVGDELPLALIEQKNGKKETLVLKEDDWDKLEINEISELFVSNQVIFIENIFYLFNILVKKRH